MIVENGNPQNSGGLGHDGSAAHCGDGPGQTIPVRDLRQQQCAAVCGHGEHDGVMGESHKKQAKIL